MSEPVHSRGGMLPLRIVVRSNTDWATMTPERFVAQDDDALPLPLIERAAQRDLLRLWRRVFPLGFFEYRARLQDISMASIEAARPAALTKGLGDVDAWLHSGPDEAVVLTDDDDFFSPSLSAVSRDFTADTDVVVWPHVISGYLQGSRQRSYQPQAFLFVLANNCAIRKSFLAERFTTAQVVDMFKDDATANQYLAETLGVPEWLPSFFERRMLVHPSVRFVAGWHSMYNAHLGSIFFLSSVLGDADPEGYLRSLDIRSPLFLPKDAAGLEPYVRRLEAIWPH